MPRGFASLRFASSDSRLGCSRQKVSAVCLLSTLRVGSPTPARAATSRVPCQPCPPRPRSFKEGAAAGAKTEAYCRGACFERFETAPGKLLLSSMFRPDLCKVSVHYAVLRQSPYFRVLSMPICRSKRMVQMRGCSI